MDRIDIEKAANNLLQKMWEQRHLLVPEREVTRLEIADPALAAKFLLIEFVIDEQIGGQFAYRGQKFETAGLLDRQARKIAVSRRFPKDVLVFTAAHEIGHWVIHPNEVMVHRDRAVSWPPAGGQARPKLESEADYFAACFLMPRNLVMDAVEGQFGSCPVVIDDRVAFAMDTTEYEILLRAKEGSVERARAVARASRFGLKPLHPLHKRFGVSVSAMAYRLRELELVR
jgi:Zn-dependent peptidase ImmA (M78 family)